MMKVLINFFVIAVSFSLIFTACKSEDSNPAGPTTGSQVLSINHWGVDFSEGTVGSQSVFLAPDKIDGEVINWCEYSTSGSNYYNQLVVFRPTSGMMYKVTATDLAGVTTTDTTKWNTNLDCGTVKLKPNDIWIIKATDGYVAFKVIEAPQDSATIAASTDWWTIKVEYKYSANLSF
ncbi:MAG: hypothetical protein K8H86_11575 [Ignavibacteriaceae bacterium]|nr:hypothetical protein [Ignavibacteriaceae bacterium]